VAKKLNLWPFEVYIGNGFASNAKIFGFRGGNEAV